VNLAPRGTHGMSIDKIPVPRSTHGRDRSILAGHALVKMLIESRGTRVGKNVNRVSRGTRREISIQSRKSRAGDVQIGSRGRRVAGVYIGLRGARVV